jgi:hypothetical protein
MKKIVFLNFAVLAIGFLLLLFGSCSKDEEINLAPGKVTLSTPSNNATNIALDATLNWQSATDPDGDVIVYDVYFGTDANPVNVASANQGGTSYTPTLTANSTYYWKVVAKDPNGASSQSATWSFNTLNNGPGTVTLTAPTDESMDITLDASLTWQAVIDPDGDDIVYDVYFGTDATPETIASADQASTSFEPSLNSGTMYYWKIVAKDNNGGISESPIWSFTTINNPPGSVALTIPSNEEIEVVLDATLEWQEASDPDGDLVVYDVYFGIDVDPAAVVSSDQSATSYTPTLEANTTYYWKIVAKDDKGSTSESAIWSFTTLNNNPGAVTLTAPVNEASDINLDATLTWEAVTDPDGDEVVYDVYFGTDAEPITIVSTEQTELSYTPSLAIGTTYYWKVVAKDPNGGYSESDVWSFTPKIQIGDFYEGGVVFYIDETGMHGYVCPIVDTNPVLPEVHGGWGCNSAGDLPGADGIAIGTGSQNTLDILAACTTDGIAADMCAKLTLNGYSDWFLPSLDELGEMKKNKDIINAYALAHGGAAFTNAYYYSSSEKDGFFVYAHGFYSINANFMVGKANLNYPFRAIRAF